MNFFITLHRSVFDKKLYDEINSFRRREILFFFLNLLFFFTFITAIANTLHLFVGKDNISSMVAEVFNGISIRDGKLYSSAETPYVPPSYMIAPILNKIFGLPEILNDEAESLIVVDTALTELTHVKVPAIILSRDKISVFLQKKISIDFFYNNLGVKNLIFSKEEIHNLLKRNIVTIFLLYFFSVLVNYGAILSFCVWILAFSAFVFRINRRKKIKEYLKIAILAVSPVPIGATLFAIAGVKKDWMWHVLILVSTIIMFRAVGEQKEVSEEG
ncbi:MAG: DUF1189 family protein [Chitinispirillaceae bacterium]|nr:DUF1189 family protein [Chitinispirillaceae bacterium]